MIAGIRFQRNFCDFNNSICIQVLAFSHPSNDFCEFSEIHILLCLERVLLEKIHDHSKTFQFSYSQLHSIIAINSDNATLEESLDSVQQLHISLVLDYSKFRQYLITYAHFGVPVYADVKTSFAIGKTDYPIWR